VTKLSVKLSSKVLKESASLEKRLKKGEVKALVATITVVGKPCR
jgi:hypothetical protein